MIFFWVLGMLGLLLMITDRLVDIPWWSQLALMGAVGLGVTALAGGALLSVPAAVYLATVGTTLQNALVEWIHASRARIGSRQVTRTALPWET